MKNLTLVIPAKFEASTLPIVLNEIEKLNLNCEKIIVVPEYDKDTLKALENFDCNILIQKGEGFGNAIIQGLNNSTTEYSCIFNADGSFDPKYLDEMLNKIKGVEFNWRHNNRKSWGIIAQEVEQIMPEAVYGGNGNRARSVNYNCLVGLLVETVKNQNKRMKEMEKKLEDTQEFLLSNVEYMNYDM